LTKNKDENYEKFRNLEKKFYLCSTILKIIMTIDIIKDDEKRNKIRFVYFIIHEFARAYKINNQMEYRYLKTYGGLDFLFEHWWALHTDNPLYAVRDLYDVCAQNGGVR
jgi:hypothetical protein